VKKNVDPNIKLITSPIKGIVIFTFHEIMEEKVFKIGDKVNKGDRICYIYSDLFQGFEEVKADCDGEIIEINVKQGTIVNAGNTILKVKLLNNNQNN
jgi:acetyl-CoA carboxylase biotin carboxyl carrier protein